MRIHLVSSDQLCLDAVSMSLDLLFDCELRTYSQVSLAVQESIAMEGPNCLLIVDDCIPGVDYWELVRWLSVHFQGKLIILSTTKHYGLYAEKMMRDGCYAVLDKTDGFAACWGAIQAASENNCYSYSQKASPFLKLKAKDRTFASELLDYDVSELSKIKGITQQAVNKKKLAIYRKLNVSPVPRDKTFRLVAKLFHMK